MGTGVLVLVSCLGGLTVVCLGLSVRQRAWEEVAMGLYVLLLLGLVVLVLALREGVV